MSLILDALNKADREREPAPAIPTIAAPFTPSTEANTALPGWVYAIAGALAVSVVVMLVLLFKIGGATSTSVPASATTPSNLENTAAQNAPSVSAKPLSAEPNEPVEAAKAVKLAEPNSPDEPSNFAQYELQKPVVKEASAQTALKPIVSEAVANLYGDTKPEATPLNTPEKAALKPVENKAADAPAPTKQTKPKAAKPAEPLVSDEELAELWREAQQETTPPEPPKTQQGKFAQLPYLYQLPESFQERIPTLMYQNHIFSARASAVIINGSTYKKGDLIADQLRVEEITEEDLVLSYMDKPFKLAALSSWVKMD